MADLDWSKCEAVESVPDVQGGKWVFRGTRMPVIVVFENLGDMTTEDLIEMYGVTREQVEDVLWFVSQNLRNTAPGVREATLEHAHSV